MNKKFGDRLKDARKSKKYTQRILAQKIGIDFSYLWKMEAGKLDYAPSEKVIRFWASELDLDSEELIFLAGRVPERDEELLKKYYQIMPSLFRQIKANPQITKKLLAK
ncbi:MAG: helix-turn-helix transcriptional regulator [Prochloraceae cyanobacterium]|nr:helix-turn-helix transcriptional regulator [Prochloraceae cyanobacterium]